MTAELFWFPFFAKDWLSSPARLAMNAAQRGAYIDLLAVAWGNGDSEPSLDPDPAVLAPLSGLGRDWTRCSPLVLKQFALRDGRLYNAKLSEVWTDQQTKHAKMVANGKKGGRPRKAKQKPGFQVASRGTPQLPVSGNQSESEGTLVAPTEPTSSPPASPLALGAPRSPELPVDRDVRTTGFSLIRDAIDAAVPPAPQRRRA